jgi:hypothetical protein
VTGGNSVTATSIVGVASIWPPTLSVTGVLIPTVGVTVGSKDASVGVASNVCVPDGVSVAGACNGVGVTVGSNVSSVSLAVVVVVIVTITALPVGVAERTVAGVSATTATLSVGSAVGDSVTLSVGAAATTTSVGGPNVAISVAVG